MTKTTHGGARAGAGRKRKQPAQTDIDDPLAFLKAVAQGLIDATALQVRAAIAAAQYTHPKAGQGGKKEEKDAAAKKAAVGKFAPAKAPLKLIK